MDIFYLTINNSYLILKVICFYILLSFCYNLTIFNCKDMFSTCLCCKHRENSRTCTHIQYYLIFKVLSIFLRSYGLIVCISPYHILYHFLMYVSLSIRLEIRITVCHLISITGILFHIPTDVCNRKYKLTLHQTKITRYLFFVSKNFRQD